VRGRVLEGDEYFLVLAVFGEVDAHALKAVSGEEGDEGGVVLLHLVSDELERLPHRVLYHLLLRLLHLLEPPVQVAEHLTHKYRVGLLKRLLHCHYPLLVRIYRVHQELDHVPALTYYYSFVTFDSAGNFGN
jgi:hypothetical protein